MATVTMNPAAGEPAASTPDVAAVPEASEASSAESFALEFVANADNFDDIDLPPDPGQDSGETPDGTVPTVPTVTTVPIQPGAKPAVVAAAVEPAPAPVAPVVAAPVVSQAPVAPQASVDPAAQVPQVPAASPAADAPPVDPFALAVETIAKQEPAFVKALAENVYKVDQKDFDEVLGGNPQALGVLCARVHVNAVSSVMRTIAQQLPVYVSGLLEVNERSRRTEDKFWTANPHLNREQHRALLPPVITAYKTMNPTADEATLHKMVGLLVATANGIPLQASSAPNGNAPQVRTPGRQVRQVAPAFAPAGVNNAPGAPQAPDDNQWSRFTRIMEADQAGAFDEQG